MRFRLIGLGFFVAVCAACGGEGNDADAGGTDDYPGPCWQKIDTGGFQGTLNGVAANAPDDVYFSSEDSFDFGHFNGSAFTALTSPWVAPRLMWGAGTGYVIVSDSKAGGDIARFDGASWEILRTDVPYFSALWARSAGDVFAVTPWGASPIWHYDGASWTPMDMDVGPYQLQLDDVWAGPDGRAFAVGYKYGLDEEPAWETMEGVVLAYNGAAWTEMDLGGPSSGLWLSAIVGAPSEDLWAWGVQWDGIYDGVYHAVAVVYYYNGTSWDEMDLTTSGWQPYRVMSLSESGPDDVYAWVDAQSLADSSYKSLFLHFDGVVWSEVPLEVPAEQPEITALLQMAADDVVAIVEDTSTLAVSVVRFDGVSWTIFGQESTFTDGFRPYALLAGSAGEVVAVGWSTATADYPDGALSFWSYDGAGWTHLADGDLLWNGSSNTVSVGRTDGSLWVADGQGAVWLHDGATWIESKPANPCPGVGALWGTGPAALIAGCANGKVIRYDGTTWTAAETGTELPIVDLWGSGPSDVYAVGYRPVSEECEEIACGSALLHYDGAAWSEVDIGFSAGLTRVWGSRADNVFAAGSGTMLRFDGMSWTPDEIPDMYCDGDDVTQPVVEDLWGDERESATELFAVTSWLYPGSYSGNYLHYDGANWERLTATDDPNTYFRAVGGTGPDDIWLAGENGLLLHYPCE
jgi:hypothetical protein